MKDMATIKNARFWIWWHGSWTKLTLRPGQSLTMSHGGPTDEGFYARSEGYMHDGDRVSAWIREDSRDCDGPLSRDWDGHCMIDQLKANEADEYGPARPAWVKDSASQRDLYAEMAGY